MMIERIRIKCVLLLLLAFCEVCIATLPQVVEIDVGDDASGDNRNEADQADHGLVKDPQKLDTDEITVTDKQDLSVENGIYALSSLEDIEIVMTSFLNDEVDTTSDRFVAICLLLLYDPTCAPCSTMMKRMEEVHVLMEQYRATLSDKLENLPVLAKLNVVNMSQEDIQSVGVTSVPNLLLVRGNGVETLMLEYTGLQETASDLFRTLLHYYYRLVVTAGRVRYSAESIDIYPRHFTEMTEVWSFMKSHRHFLLEFSVVEPALPPSLSEEDKSYVRWLLQEDSNVRGDDFILFVQCRSDDRMVEDGSSKTKKLYDAFASMSRVLTSRRDRLFVSIGDCDQPDGTVLAWKIPLNFTFNNDWEHLLQCISPPAANGDTEEDLSRKLVEFMTQVSTPSVLWFDRQSTAPIAFPLYRKVHAVLFIDFHHPVQYYAHLPEENVLAMRILVHQFRDACRKHRRHSCGGGSGNPNDIDMVCLIVPSTETRVLTTFGIDIWSPLDEAISRSQSPVADIASNLGEPTLPVVLITDQRLGGTLRYYLHAQELLSPLPTEATTNPIYDFFVNVLAGKKSPHVKSSPRGPGTTSSGIQILTADSLWSSLFKPRANGQHHDSPHGLLFFTAPTCGHCKRFSVIYHQLADLLRQVEWMPQYVQLYQIDVTTDDITSLSTKYNISVRWLPDLYYLPPDRQYVVRYDEKDELDEDVGNINSALEIMAWFLKVGAFGEDDNALKLLLENLESSQKS